jgi:ankyrin repeat protein
VSQGIKPLVILAAPDATTKVEWLQAFEEGIRRSAPEEDQLDTFWVHKTHITGTLHAASVAGDAEALNTILSLSLFDADGVDGEGVTPLCAAAAGGHGECVEALLSSGATLGTTDRDGATPLHLAIAGGHTSAANTLVANGAPLDATDLLGRTPLGLLLASPHPLANPTPEHRSLASLMLAYGASPSDPDSEGFTPLHRVALVSGAGGGCEALVVALGRKGGEGSITALLQHPGGGDDALNPLHLACGARFDGEELARDGVPVPCGDGEGEGEG